LGNHDELLSGFLRHGAHTTLVQCHWQQAASGTRHQRERSGLEPDLGTGNVFNLEENFVDNKRRGTIEDDIVENADAWL